MLEENSFMPSHSCCVTQDTYSLYHYFLSLNLLCLSLTKMLPYPTKDSPHRDLHCKEEAKKKERGGQKEGRSAGDSCQSFRRFFEAYPICYTRGTNTN